MSMDSGDIICATLARGSNRSTEAAIIGLAYNSCAIRIAIARSSGRPSLSLGVKRDISRKVNVVF